MKNPIPRKTRSELRSAIKAAGGTPPEEGRKTRLVTRRDLTDALKAAERRSSLITRAAKTQRTADTLASRVTASKPRPDTRPTPKPTDPVEVVRERQLDAAWLEYSQCESQMDRRSVYAKHRELFENSTHIHRAAKFAQSQNK